MDDVCRGHLYAMVVQGFHALDTGARYSELLQARAEHTTRHCVSNFPLVSQHATSATVAFVVDEWIRADHDWRHRSRSISPTFSVGA